MGDTLLEISPFILVILIAVVGVLYFHIQDKKEERNKQK